MAIKVVTPKFRASYANVWEPRETPSGDMKYSISMIFSKDDDLTQLKEAIKKTAAEKWGDKIPKGLKNPLRDGDAERDDPVYENSVFMNAKSSNQPGIVDEKVQPIVDQKEFYSGCYARASIALFAYDQAGNKGVGVILNNLMKTEDGERLAGAAKAEEDFAAFVPEGQTEGTDEVF